ncbi:MAG: RNA polymerase sigma-54 factor, partial [Mariprofundaceae bacterium]|nr:RNA polymerase sigma-54 factor [Mariprofundaceae bacterium]
MQPKLTQKLGQRLALTPQLTQSLKVLAMNAVDLDTYIEECIESNPLLEQDESQSDMPREEHATAGNDRKPETDWREDGDNRWEMMYASSAGRDGVDMRDQQWQGQPTMGQSLHEQVDRQPMEAADRILAHALIDSLDDDGYFRLKPGELAASLHCDAETLEKTLVNIVQQLEPVGIGARDLVECLLLQLDGKNDCDALARRLLLHFSDQLFESDDVLADQMDCDIGALACARMRLRRLDPFPGHSLYGQDNIYIRPEVIFRRSAEGDISIEVPGYSWQGLRLNEQWKNKGWQGAEREFMDTATREA